MERPLISRRELLKNAAGLTVGLGLVISLPVPHIEGVPRTDGLVLQTFVRVFQDNRIEIVVAKSEMGQGVSSSLALLIADEMDADWELVSVRLEAELAAYKDPNGWGGTAGSTSVRTQFKRLRKVGANVRALLLSAASQQFGIPHQDLRAERSYVFDKNGQRLASFGELCAFAAHIPLPTAVSLKSPEQWTLIGKDTASKGSRAKAEGRVSYGIDTRLPGMLYAAVRQPRVFGARIANAAELQDKIAAPYRLLQKDQTLFVVGPSYWQAQNLIQALPVRYDVPNVVRESQQDLIEAKLMAAVRREGGISVSKAGDGKGALGLCEQTLEAEYFGPLLAHHTMEPMNGTAWVDAQHCEFWLPTQDGESSLALIAQTLERAPDTVQVHITAMGGGFGRRIEIDYVEQLIFVAKNIGVPVQLIWSRPEDTQHDFYRPAFAAKLKGGLSGQELRVWSGKNAGPSIAKRKRPSLELDRSSVEGFAETPYDIAHFEAEHEDLELGVPLGYWRSVGLSQNLFFTESFLDEIAFAAGRDPLALRLSLLKGKPRLQKLLERLREVSQWETSPDRQRMGMALLEGFGSLAAMAAKVSVVDKRLKVEQLWCVVDCGLVVHPKGAEAQVQGGALFGLAAALNGKITVKDGQIEQAYFSDLPFLKLADSPRVEVVFMPSDAAMGGLGEVAVPLAAPAVCNAIFRATGQRIRRLPIRDFSFPS